jgi:hypothetical protein
MERQALRDAVLRYNAENLSGLHDRPKGHPERRLTEGEVAAVAAVILRGPEPERDGCFAWTALDTGDVLMVTRLDRLARSTRDLLNTLAAITDRKAGFRS